MSKESKRTNTGFYESCWKLDEASKSINPVMSSYWKNYYEAKKENFGSTPDDRGVPTVLEEAASLVDGDREAVYGHPVDDFGAVSGAARVLGVDPQSGPLHHALYMVLVKIQRLVQTPEHRDSIVDGAGYFRTYEKVLEKL